MYSLKIKPQSGSQKAQDIKQSLMALEVMLEKHKLLMAHYMGTREDSFGEIDSPSSCKMRYKTMLKTTIEALEKTRKSFKSQQVEELRKRLIQELVDME